MTQHHIETFGLWIGFDPFTHEKAVVLDGTLDGTVIRTRFVHEEGAWHAREAYWSVEGEEWVQMDVAPVVDLDPAQVFEHLLSLESWESDQVSFTELRGPSDDEVRMH